MNTYEDAMASELAALLRAEVPSRAVRLTVRELLVARMEQGPLGARAVSQAIEDTMRAACRLVRELNAPEEIVETVCQAALEAVRGHGGQSARWVPEAWSAATAVLEEVAREFPEDSDWQWLAGRVRLRFR
jgi:hypothetical protein